MAEAVYPVPADWAENAHVDEAGYQAMYRRSIEQPEAFWAEQAQRIDWMRPFTQVKETSFHRDDFGIAWFADGTLNRSSSRSYRPADSANRNAGTRPAADTRFGSSNTGRIV